MAGGILKDLGRRAKASLRLSKHGHRFGVSNYAGKIYWEKFISPYFKGMNKDIQKRGRLFVVENFDENEVFDMFGKDNVRVQRPNAIYLAVQHKITYDTVKERIKFSWIVGEKDQYGNIIIVAVTDTETELP